MIDLVMIICAFSTRLKAAHASTVTYISQRPHTHTIGP